MKNIDLPDIDIDVKDKAEALSGLDYVVASVYQDNELRRHPTGVFFQSMPLDPITKLAVFPSGEKAGNLSDKMGFYKIDLIPNSAYKHVKSPEHLKELVDQNIVWTLFKDKSVVEKLQHINGHFDIIDAYGPDNIEDLACLIAIIRPGKMHLIGEPWEKIREEVWIKDTNDQYSFKKSHAIAFAVMITVQLKSMVEAGLL